MGISLLIKETEFGAPDPKAQTYFAAAIQYLNGSTTAKMLIKELEGCNYDVFVLVATECLPMFVALEHIQRQGLGIDGSVIIWDPTSTVTAYKNRVPTMQSPAIALAHEMGHGVQWVKNRGWYLAYVGRALRGDEKAKLVIENDNIKMYETPVAQELGEAVRENYYSSAPYQQAKKNYKCPYQLLPLAN